MSNYHNLDPHPFPEDEGTLFVNEPTIVDGSIPVFLEGADTVAVDNVRVYVPIDLNRAAILRRLQHVMCRYGEANESNEMCFEGDVEQLIVQIEIYDQIHYVRNMPEGGRHSVEAVSLVEEFVERLEKIPDGCAECFPFEMIERLRVEYLGG